MEKGAKIFDILQSGSLLLLGAKDYLVKLYKKLQLSTRKTSLLS